MIAAGSGESAVKRACQVLKEGGSSIDAVEQGIRKVESDPNNHSVGYGGYPNILGQVELDASIMSGKTLEAGAVAGLRRCRHPISVARKVMKELPHVLLVGEGADRFAEEMGFSREELLTEATKISWNEIVNRIFPEREIAGPALKELRKYVRITRDPEKPTETVNLIALDGNGDLASGTSTSGWAWKYPGRAGDSPIIGAGNYADNKYGAATCTGRGEMAIRSGTARSVVLYIKMGKRIEDACWEAMYDLSNLKDPYFGWVDIIVMSPTGEIFGITWKENRYIYYMTDKMDSPDKKPKILFSPDQQTAFNHCKNQ